MNKYILTIIGLACLVALFLVVRDDNQNDNKNENPTAEQGQIRRVDFSKVNSTYGFSGEISLDWRVEYIGETGALNIYDPSEVGVNNLERSQIFIRNFKANSFLTLPTVNILNRQETTVGDHQAVRYEIEKKDIVPNFSGQPLWRSARHKLIDIRSSNESPTVFYVIAANPELDSSVFEDFIAGLIFYSD